MIMRQTLNSVCLLHSKREQKERRGGPVAAEDGNGGFKREKDLLLFRISRDPTVDRLREKKESCSTRSGLRVDTGFEEF